ncbi:MAG: hypothetical protein LJU34_00810 [Oscillospiraceae bacterium]|nr:hypothetical protein [Oscillospiraceae bacterium]
MNTNKKTYKPIRPIELPGLENKLYANEVSDHVEIIHHKMTDASQVFDAITQLQEYGEQHGLEYIIFHPRTCDPYYPALMEMLDRTFRIENYDHLSVHEFYRLYWR